MSFTIENNVLVGNQNPDFTEKRSLAKVMLETLTEYPDAIGRVIT